MADFDIQALGVFDFPLGDAFAQARLVGQQREAQLDAAGVGLDLGLVAGVGELGQVGGANSGVLNSAMTRELGRLWPVSYSWDRLGRRRDGAGGPIERASSVGCEPW